MIALWTGAGRAARGRVCRGPVTAWSILRTDRLGKDSFRVELADAALPDGRLRFSARVGRRGLVHGPSGRGAAHGKRGRAQARAARARDGRPARGLRVRRADRERASRLRRLPPACSSRWGFRHGATRSLPRAPSKQPSAARAARSCRTTAPRPGSCRRVCWQTAGVCLTATRRSGGTALQGGTVRERSVQALAGIGVLHAAGTTYENPAGGRETRWRSALAGPPRRNLPGPCAIGASCA